MPPLTLHQALTHAQHRGLPRQEANYLLQALLNVDRAWLIRHDDQALTPEQAARFEDWLAQRLDEVPLAYLSGEKEFHGLRLRVTRDTLIPRPDTELLVDWALEHLQALPAQPRPRVVDLGTGSGAIALAVAARHRAAELHMVDRSAAALAVAEDNARRLGLPVQAHLGSWFEPLRGLPPFDLVLSNPPYVAGQDPHLAALRHEPRGALTPEGDGLADLQQLVREAPARLKPGGWLLLEHGWDQAEAVRALLCEQGYQAVETRRDLGDQPRASGGRWPG